MVARPFTQSAEQQHEGSEKEHVSRGIGKAARGPFDVLHQARAEADANGNGGEDQRERDRPGEREEATKQREHEKRQQQNEREIAEISFAENDVLGGAQIAQPRRKIEHGFAPFERAGDVAVNKPLQDHARIAVVDEAVITAVERAHAADKARVVEDRDEERRRDQRERQHNAARAQPHQQRDHRGTHGERERGLDELAQPHGPGGHEPHREVLCDGDAENFPPSILARERAALHVAVRQRFEMLVVALPQHLAAPAQLAADEIRGEAIHDEPWHRERPLMEKRKRAAVAVRARKLAHLRIPVVGKLVDEAEAQPHRIGKVDSRHTPRIGRMLENAVGGKGEALCRKCLPTPTAVLVRRAAPLARIGGVELRGHVAKNLARQT